MRETSFVDQPQRSTATRDLTGRQVMGRVTEQKTTCSRVAGTSVADNGGTDVAGVERREQLAMTPAAATELVTRQVLVTITWVM